MRCRHLLILIGLLSPSMLHAEDNWPAFRGGAKAGVAEGAGLPLRWDRQTAVLWKVDVPGRGWSSPIVWGDRVWVTSVTSDQDIPASRKGLYIQDVQGKVPPGTYRWLVHCLDARTGKQLWQRQAFQGQPAGPIHIKNSYATETPVTDGERVYAYFGNVGLFCYDTGGKLLWSKKWPAHRTRFGWGTAASPALHDGRLYIVNDNEEESFLVALDARTGKQLWRVARDEKSSWATPFVWKHKERTEIVTAATGQVRSYDLDGKLLWHLGGMSAIAIPTPFAHKGLLFVCSGYVGDFLHRPVFAIEPGAGGDITPPPGSSRSKGIAWWRPLAGPYNPTPIAYGDYLYVLLDRGQLSCYEAATGKVVYEKERLGAPAFTASPWAYQGKVFCLSEDGETFVVEAGPRFKVVAKNPLDEMTLATPATANGRLFIRTQTKLYCLGKEAK